MIKHLAVAIILAFVVCTPGMLFADSEYKNASEWCKANDELGYKKHGQCVSFVTLCYERGNTGPVCACKEYMNNTPVGFYVEYNNLGECISHLRQGYVAAK